MPIKKTNEHVLMQAIQSGLNVTEACIAAEIARDTYYRKIKRDKIFAGKVERAEVEYEQLLLLSIRKAGLDPAKWTAHAWLLERKHPDRWGLKQSIEHKGNVDDPLRIQYVPAKENRDNKDLPTK